MPRGVKNVLSHRNTGAEALAVILKESSSLSFVSLEWNQIASEGATSLAEALAFNTSLLHVDLRNNGIGDDGALALAKMLEENDTLKTLDLRWNQVKQAEDVELGLDICAAELSHCCCLWY